MSSPLRYYTDLMDRVFGDENRSFQSGLDVGTGIREDAFHEIAKAYPNAFTSQKLVILKPGSLSDMAYDEFCAFMKAHKFDVHKDVDGAISVKMSVRKR